MARVMAWADPGRLEEWAGLGLTITQIRLLFLLRRLKSPPARLLAQEMDVSPSTLTRIVDRLERQGLVRRTTDRRDRRQVRHSLTRRGEEVVARLEQTGRAHLAQLLSHLSDEELAQVMRALHLLLRPIMAAEQREPVSL